MADCNHECEGCPSSGKCENEIPKAVLNGKSSIKKVVAVLSGKGGVGKSFVTSLLAAKLKKEGYKVGILDADITGPSIPKAFGITEKAYGENDLLLPVRSFSGIRIMSSNLLLDDDSDPIVWRGVLLGNLAKQFYEETLWEDLDYLLIDMPPGTGDVALTTFQTLPVDDLIIVTSPQDLVSMIVTKAIKMANEMHIKILGVIENMSYVTCPNCQEKIYAFGESHLDEFARKMKFDVLAKLPLVAGNATMMDKGLIEEIDMPEIAPAVEAIIKEK